MQRSALSRNIVGYRALGHHGELGVVVELRDEPEFDSRLIVVRGGVSNGLTYFVPAARVRSLSARDRTVCLDIDFPEFTPRLHEDGTVELRAAS